MIDGIELVLFDIGGVLGSNAWDREQRAAAVDKFHLDKDDFQYRHEETVGAFEAGQITLDEYLDVTVFCEDRAVSREEFKRFMFAQSVPWEPSIAVARDVSAAGRVRLATLNNESEELNQYRIQEFGLHELFPTFFTSCWLGVRKPTREIYERVLGMTQTSPAAVLFIDDRAQNLTPAAALGIRTLQFKSADKLRHDLAELRLV
jgi:putative hydrolase of the HAD superfamily